MSVQPIDPGALSLAATGLRDALQIAFPPQRFQFGFMPPRLSPREWSQLVNRPPFVGLGWNEIKPTSNGGRLFKGEASFSVFLVIENKSGVRNRYLGDAQGPGLFQMLQAASIVLNGCTIPGVGSCFVTRASNAFAEGWEAENLAMAAVDVAVNVTLDVPTGLAGPEATPDLLRQIAASWSFSEDGVGADIQDISQFAPQASVAGSLSS